MQLRYGSGQLGRYVPHPDRPYVHTWMNQNAPYLSGLGQAQLSPFPWELERPDPKAARKEKWSGAAQVVAVIGGILGIMAVLGR